VLSVVGMERLQWETTSSSTNSSTNTTTTTTTTHKQKLELFSSELLLAPPKQYEPGDYEFPFRCMLPPNLPPSFEFKKSTVQDMHNLRAYVDYKLKATLPVRGFLRADLEGKHLIQILPNVNPVARSAQATRSQEVELLGMFSRGTCDLTARLRRDVLRVGQTADIRCKIQNQSKKRVRNVSSSLYQDITVTPLKGDGGIREYTCTLNETGLAVGNDEAGKLLDVSLTPRVVTNSLHSASSMVPSHTGNLFTVQYRLRVKCSYSLCPSTKVEFPVTILP
jgi:hypothetical protein